MKPCCEKKEDREVIEKHDDGSTVERCKTCGAKHYHIFMDAGKLNAKVLDATG